MRLHWCGSRQQLVLIAVLSAIVVASECQQATPPATAQVNIATTPATTPELATRLRSLSADEQASLRKILANPRTLDTNGNPRLVAIARDLCRLTLDDADELGKRLDELHAGAVVEFALVPLQRQEWAIKQIGQIQDRLTRKLSLQYPQDVWSGNVTTEVRELPWLKKRTKQQILEVIGLRLTCEPDDLGPAKTDISNTDLEVITALPALRNLDLRQSEISDAGLAHLTGLRRLKTLNLTSTPISDAGLKSLAELSNLTELQLEFTKVTGTGLEHLARCHHLSTLVISQGGGSRLELRFLNRLKSLVKLTINAAGKLDLHDLPSLTSLSVILVGANEEPNELRLANLPVLQTANVSLYSMSEKTPVIENLPELLRLSINTDAKTLPCVQLSLLTNVRELAISGTNLRFSAADVQLLSDLHRLTRLHLGGQLDPDCLQHLRHLTALRRLAFGGNLDDVELSALNAMKLLQVLTIWNMHGSGQGFKVLPQFPNLKEIHLSSMNLDSLQLTELPSLQIIQFNNCQIQKLDLHNLPKLKTVNCSSLTTTAMVIEDLPSVNWLSFSVVDADKIQKLSLQGMAKLQTLQLTPIKDSAIEGIPYITSFDDSMLARFAAFPKLESLTFRFGAVTEEGLQSLRDSRTLRSVDLTGCRHVSEDSRRQLREFLQQR